MKNTFQYPPEFSLRPPPEAASNSGQSGDFQKQKKYLYFLAVLWIQRQGLCLNPLCEPYTNRTLYYILTSYWVLSILKKGKRTRGSIPLKHILELKNNTTKAVSSSSDFAEHHVVLNDPKMWKVTKLYLLYSLSYFPLGIFLLPSHFEEKMKNSAYSLSQGQEVASLKSILPFFLSNRNLYILGNIPLYR